jgi:hypothetical protein
VKKLILAANIAVLASFGVVFFSGCQKSSTSGPQEVWYLGDITYTGNGMQVQTNRLLCLGRQDDPNTYVVVQFASLPTASGRYKVASIARADSNNLSPRECAVLMTTSAYDSYESGSRTPDSVTVTVNNSKIAVSVPNIIMYHYYNSTFAGDTLTGSATLTQ